MSHIFLTFLTGIFCSELVIPHPLKKDVQLSTASWSAEYIFCNNKMTAGKYGTCRVFHRELPTGFLTDLDSPNLFSVARIASTVDVNPSILLS